MIRNVNNLKDDREIYYDDPRNCGKVIEGLAVNLCDCVENGIIPSTGITPSYNQFAEPSDIGHVAPDDFAMMSLADALQPVNNE